MARKGQRLSLAAAMEIMSIRSLSPEVLGSARVLQSLMGKFKARAENQPNKAIPAGSKRFETKLQVFRLKVFTSGHSCSCLKKSLTCQYFSAIVV
jgi:hypothetical protein